MRKTLIGLFAASLLLVAVAAFADKSATVYKTDDAVNVCACGESCDCKTMSRNAGKCTCGKDMVKGVISNIDGDKAVVKVEDKELNSITKAKFACGCGETCKCGTISQKPGKCTCGTEMKKVM